MENTTKIRKQIVYVLGTLYELGQKGLVQGKNALSKKGLKQFKELKKSGFKMTEGEVTNTMDFLREEGMVKTLGDIKAETQTRTKKS